MKKFFEELLRVYKKIPLPAKASMWFVFCSVVQKGIAFITTPIFTRMMSTKEYGLVSVYIAACGLLWSNWCEYKRNLGVEFGEYSLRQYRYAKDYYRIVQEELKKQGEKK